jgi:hypothetical protein
MQATTSTVEAVSPGSVFISYSRQDLARVERVVKLFSDADLHVWWDRDIEVGTAFRSAIQAALDEAACVVVFWSITSVESEFVRSEASQAHDKGILKPVLLDVNVRIPVGFSEIQHLDLTKWDGTTEQLRPLIDPIRRLVSRGPSKSRYASTLIQNDWAVDNSQQIIAELSSLTAQIRQLGDILVSESQGARDLRGALGEVAKTYRVVNSAVLQFLNPALGTGPIDARPYLEFERGGLTTQIEKGRGHCGLILTYYGRYGGVRDSIINKLSPKSLSEVDTAFARLGTADGDLFVPLIQIGDVLTNESRVIVNLILSGQEDAARKRILDGRMKLAPLENQLSTAMRELQESASALGYTEPL